MYEKIVISDQFYIGFQKRHDIGTMLGFATYYEDNAACRKRMETINNWSDKKIKKETFDNVPTKGMRLAKNVTHGGGWNDTSTYWRVEDPRGFELEITSGNLAKLLGYCNITEGVLSEDCVWGWDKSNGSKVVLLPVNSDVYKHAKKTTEVHYAKSLALSDMKLGDKVKLKNGVEGVYFGKVTYGYYTSEFPDFGKINLDQTYVFYINNKALFYMKSPEIIDVTPTKTPYTTEEAEKFLMDHVKARRAIQTAGNADKHRFTLFITYDAKKNIKFETELEEIPVETVKNRLMTAVKSQAGKNRSWDSKIAGWNYQYNQTFGPWLAKVASTFYLMEGINSKEADKYFNPRYRYDTTLMKNVYDAPAGSVVDFMNGSMHLLMNGHPLAVEPDLAEGLKPVRNPYYDEHNKHGRWSGQDRIPTCLEKHEAFWLDTATSFYALRIKYKGQSLSLLDRTGY